MAMRHSAWWGRGGAAGWITAELRAVHVSSATSATIKSVCLFSECPCSYT